MVTEILKQDQTVLLKWCQAAKDGEEEVNDRRRNNVRKAAPIFKK